MREQAKGHQKDMNAAHAENQEKAEFASSRRSALYQLSLAQNDDTAVQAWVRTYMFEYLICQPANTA